MLGVIMPVVLQNESMLEMTLETLRTIRCPVPWSFYLMCNRLTVRSIEDMLDLLRANLDGPRSVACQVQERTVAGAWNEGIRLAQRDGIDMFLVMANDVRLQPDTVDELLKFSGRCDLWTAVERRIRGTPDRVTDGADFSCFMLTSATVEKHGTFDENYKPAYFEDNDYCARIVLGGGEYLQVHAAVHDHLGSQTKVRDAEMAHHVKHWFPANKDYFQRKWGRIPGNSRQEILDTYHRSPFDSGKPLSWWELEDSRK